MTAQFGRIARVEFGKPGTPGARVIEANGLRIAFRCQHTRSSTPSGHTVSIYNAAKGSGAFIQRPGTEIRVYAGYQSSGTLKLIASGNPVQGGVRESKSGPTRVLTVQFGDGLTAYTDSIVNRSYATQVNLRTLLDDAIDELGLAVGEISADLSDGYPLGVTVSEKASTLLDRISRRVAADWFIRDGSVCLVPKNQPTNEQAIVISSPQGNLIGEPVEMEDRKIGVRALLAPDMRPGKPFILESLAGRSEYVAQDVLFTGDTVQGEYVMEIVGVVRQ